MVAERYKSTAQSPARIGSGGVKPKAAAGVYAAIDLEHVHKIMEREDYRAPLVLGAFARKPRPTLVPRFGLGWLIFGPLALIPPPLHHYWSCFNQRLYAADDKVDPNPENQKPKDLIEGIHAIAA